MLVVKRKNLVISILVILLVITGYLNFAYNQNVLNANGHVEMVDKAEDRNEGITVSDSVSSDEDIISESENEEIAETSGAGFFMDYRFERENTRKKEIEYINSIVDNPQSDPEMKNEAQAQLLEITRNMEMEMAIEALIKSKGFDDAVVIVHQGSVSVIVDKSELQPDEVAQILDIVTRQSGQSPDNIKIIPKL